MQVTITCPISFIRLSIYLLSSLGLGFHIYLNTQEKAFPTPARTKSYQPPSPPVPKVVPLVRSASEDQVVLKQEEVGEVVKDEMPWTEAMVQDMFDCLDQVRQQYDNHCLCKKNHSDVRSVERTPFIPGKGGIGFNSKCRGESQVINDQRLKTPQDISNYFWTCKVVQSRHRFMEDDSLTCNLKVAPTLGVTSS